MTTDQDKKPKRGLGALLGTEIKLDGKKVNVLSVEVDKIKFSRYQPRTVINDEKLEELKAVSYTHLTLPTKRIV